MIRLREATPAEVEQAEAEKCQARPSPRSTARCEMPKEHEKGAALLLRDTHGGRTRGGYWKFWPVAK